MYNSTNKFNHNYLLEIFRSFWLISLHTKQTIQSKICSLITLQWIISHHLYIKWVITMPDERELQRDINLQLSFKLKYWCPLRQNNIIKFLLPLKNNIFNLKYGWIINVLWLVVVDNLSKYRCLFVWQCTGTKIFEDYSELSNHKQQTKSKGAVYQDKKHDNKKKIMSILKHPN